MLITVFPNRFHVDPRHTPTCPLEHIDMVKWPNLFMYYKTRKDVLEGHLSSLSIKSVFTGKEHYSFEGQRLSVDSQSYLVLNHSRPYFYEISREHEVESFCVFFEAEFSKSVLTALTKPLDKLLDDPTLQTEQPVLFFERLYQPDTILTPVLLRLKYCVSSQLRFFGFYEECFHDLLERLIRLHRLAKQELNSLSSVRFSTRIELYRRLHIGKDYIDSNYHKQLTLARVATEAHLSKHHFLRLFKQFFNKTPHQYLIAKRLAKARSLLESTSIPITEICFDVGITEPSSFSRLFKSHFGISPIELRRSSVKPQFFQN